MPPRLTVREIIRLLEADGWQLVSPAKLGSWYLLMYISFVLVAAVHRPREAQPKL